MRSLRLDTLRSRLVLLITVITAAAIAFVYLYVVPQLESSLTAEKLRRLERLGTEQAPRLAGARLRIRPTVYLIGEFIPRVGYTPGVNHGTFAIEKRAGGHVFQLNFSNGLGNTPGQLARGGTGSEDWYLGFNISRKFF